MSSSQRYFDNPYPDYPGGKVDIPVDYIKSQSDKYIQTIFDKQRTTLDDCEGGLYVGLDGISYLCHYLANHASFSSRKGEILEKAGTYMNIALYHSKNEARDKRKVDLVSFLLGNGGAHAMTAVLFKNMEKPHQANDYIKHYAHLARICTKVDFLDSGSDEIFVGRAGYLCGVLFLQSVFKQKIVGEEIIQKICDVIIESGTAYSKQHNSPCPLMYAYHKTEYLGAAHGLCAILQMLLSFPEYLSKNPDAEGKVRESTDFLLSSQTESGNFPSSLDEVKNPRKESRELVHWCHGAPGVVYLMAKAYLYWKDDKYLQSCLKCGDCVWAKGLLKKGPGICHGVAGSGYVFLLLYRLTNDEKHLYRAVKFAEFLSNEEFISKARVPDRPLSLYEGIAGTVCFLGDLLDPKNAAFPFFDVFQN